MTSPDVRAAGETRNDRRTPLLLFLGTLAVYLLTATWTYRVSIDTEAVSLPAWWFTQNGTFDLTGLTTSNPWIVPANDGLHSNRLPGAILVNLPAYAVLRLSTFSVVPSALTAALVAAGAMTAVFLVLRTLVARHVALLGALTLAFATGTWTVSADAAWTHGPAQLGIALGLLGAARGGYLRSGLGFALAVISRPHTAVIAASTGIWMSFAQRDLRPALRIGIGSAVGVVGLVAYHRITLGQWSVLGSYQAQASGALAPSSRAWFEDVAGLFVAPERGLFIYSTFLILLLPGLPRAWSAAPDWVRGSSVGAVLYLVLQLAGNVFHGGSAFYGYRLPLEALVAATPLLAMAGDRWTLADAPRRRVFAAFVAASLWIHALGAVMYGADEYSPEPWARFAPVDVVRQASALQLLQATALAVVIFAVMVTIWLRRPRPIDSANPSESLPAAPTTTPAEPTDGLAPPSSESPRGLPAAQ